MEHLLSNTTIKPAVHQMEGHPWLQQHEFMKWHKQHGIHVTHYSPFGNLNQHYKAGGLGRLIDDPVLVGIGKHHGKLGSQVCEGISTFSFLFVLIPSSLFLLLNSTELTYKLAWAITMGHSVLTKSKTPHRIKTNLEGDFILTDEEMEQIAKIDRKLRFNDDSEILGMDLFSDLEGKNSYSKPE